MRRLWFTSLIILNFLLLANTVYLHLIHQDYKKIAANAVFDTDLARNSYIKGTEYFYRAGCLQGMEWENEQADHVGDYDYTNPVLYCNKNFKDREYDTMLDMLKTLGRRAYGEL